MNSQRGVYQPLVENVSVYNLVEEEAEDEERSRVPLLIVIALIVLAAFAGVVWLAYNQGVQRGRASVALVSAPDGPVRTAPDDAGGVATPYTGLKIYDQPVPPDQEAQSSALAPQAIGSAIANPVTPPPAAEAPPARLSPPPVAAPAPKAAAQAKPQIAQAAPQVASAAPTAPAAPKAAGGAMLQIGSYPTVDAANGAFAIFKARYGAAAGEIAQDVQKADLGAKGIWYRLRVGPYTDKVAAGAACAKLKAQGATCILAAP